MCRWLVWCGREPILLADLILSPAHSLIHQSFSGGFHPGADCQNNMTLNADGFGVGWYTKRGAAIFRSITAAWNNRNLRELCSTIESQCIFAHVRAASEGGIISEQNCHPFRYGRLLFQHNGHIENFKMIKRRMVNSLRDDLFTWIEGTTDSEACFALVLNEIDPELLASGEPIPPKMLRLALLNAIALIDSFLSSAGVVDGFSTYNFALTDGVSVVVSRYCDKAPAIPSPSLYYAFADSTTLREELLRSTEARTPCAPGHGAHSIVNQLRASTGGAGSTAAQGVSSLGGGSQLERGAFICASEPLTTQLDQWHLIAENTMLCFTLEDGLCDASADDTDDSAPPQPSGCGARTAGSSNGNLPGKLRTFSRSTSSLQSLVLSPPTSQPASQPSSPVRSERRMPNLSKAGLTALPVPLSQLAHQQDSELAVTRAARSNSLPSPAIDLDSGLRDARLEVLAAPGDAICSKPPLPPSTTSRAEDGTREGSECCGNRRCEKGVPRADGVNADRVSIMPLTPGRLQKILDARASGSAAWRQRFVISALTAEGATQ